MTTPDKNDQAFKEQVLRALKSTGLSVTLEDLNNVTRTATVRIFNQELTYDLLKDISVALRTTSINIVSTIEHGYYGDVEHFLELEIKDIAPPECTEDPRRHVWGGSHGVVNCSNCGAQAIEGPEDIL